MLQAQSEHFKVFEETIAECDRLRGYATQFIRDYVSHLAIVSFLPGYQFMICVGINILISLNAMTQMCEGLGWWRWRDRGIPYRS